MRCPTRARRGRVASIKAPSLSAGSVAAQGQIVTGYQASRPTPKATSDGGDASGKTPPLEVTEPGRELVLRHSEAVAQDKKWQDLKTAAMGLGALALGAAAAIFAGKK